MNITDRQPAPMMYQVEIDAEVPAVLARAKLISIFDILSRMRKNDVFSAARVGAFFHPFWIYMFSSNIRFDLVVQCGN